MQHAALIREYTTQKFFPPMEQELQLAKEQGDKYWRVVGDTYLNIPPLPDIDWVEYWETYIAYYKYFYYEDAITFEEYQTDIA